MDKDQDAINVPMGVGNGFVKVSYPDILFTEGLCQCMGIALYDPETKTGYMLHEPNLNGRILEEFLQPIIIEHGDISRFKAAVTGGLETSYIKGGKELWENVEEERAEIEVVLKKYLKKRNIKIRWSEMSLELDTKRGRFVIG